MHLDSSSNTFAKESREKHAAIEVTIGEEEGVATSLGTLTVNHLGEVHIRSPGRWYRPEVTVNWQSDSENRWYMVIHGDTKWMIWMPWLMLSWTTSLPFDADIWICILRVYTFVIICLYIFIYYIDFAPPCIYSYIRFCTHLLYYPPPLKQLAVAAMPTMRKAEISLLLPFQLPAIMIWSSNITRDGC